MMSFGITAAVSEHLDGVFTPEPGCCGQMALCCVAADKLPGDKRASSLPQGTGTSPGIESGLNGDYCSVVTFVDQSDAKLVCMLFNANRDALPKIYKNGDIVRFHRIKVREFNGQMQGITSSGFAALSFDGTVGAPVIPRATSKSFTFTDEDEKALEDLRIWVARNSSNSVPAMNLSSIHPQMFFDLTCQLVGKAKVDGSSYLLKVCLFFINILIQILSIDTEAKCPFESKVVFSAYLLPQSYREEYTS